MGSSLLVNSPLNPINNTKISIIIFCVNYYGHSQIIARMYTVSYADGPKPRFSAIRSLLPFFN
jgi:hypothetical protein